MSRFEGADCTYRWYLSEGCVSVGVATSGCVTAHVRSARPKSKPLGGRPVIGRAPGRRALLSPGGCGRGVQPWAISLGSMGSIERGTPVIVLRSPLVATAMVKAFARYSYLLVIWRRGLEALVVAPVHYDGKARVPAPSISPGLGRASPPLNRHLITVVTQGWSAVVSHTNSAAKYTFCLIPQATQDATVRGMWCGRQAPPPAGCPSFRLLTDPFLPLPL